MNIYTPITITEEIRKRFKPTRLAIKELNGVKYFCKSVRKDIEKYTGSGVRWTNHVKKHGREHIRTLWISEWFYCPERLQFFALEFSKQHNIVESSEWANLIPENGLTGNTGSKKGHMAGIPKPKSNMHRDSISKTLTGITLEYRHGKEKADEIRSKMSLAKIGNKKSKETIEKTRQTHLGSKRGKETKQRMKEAQTRRVPLVCEHCGKSVLPGNFHRWHGDCCLSNPKHLKRKVNTTNSCKNRSKKVVINEKVYASLKEAYTLLNLPRNLLGNMLKKNITSNSKWGIVSFEIINDETLDQQVSSSE